MEESAYTAALIEHASGRSSDSANPRAGPLEPRLFNPHLKEILSSKTNNGASSSGGLILRSVVGSGTEAVRSFWDIAEAYAPCQEGAQLLILRGAYVGGSGPQQSISGLKFVRDRSFASNAARRLEPFIVDAPYRKLDLYEALLMHRGNKEKSSRLDEEEEGCLEGLEDTLCSLRGEGHTIAGVLIEFVRACDGRCLSPASPRR